MPLDASAEELSRSVWAARPLDRIVSLTEQQKKIKSDIVEAVAEARRQGLSWEQIGAALGITKQTAHERFSKFLVESDPVTTRTVTVVDAQREG